MPSQAAGGTILSCSPDVLVTAVSNFCQGTGSARSGYITNTVTTVVLSAGETACFARAWEKVSLGTFARGRVDFVQTFTPAARAFLEAAASAAAHTANSNKDMAQARGLMYEATSVHSRIIAAASHGRGAVCPLYALRGVAIQRGLDLPGLFRTRAWDYTRRGGPGQDVRLGFMRFASSDGDVGTHAGNGLGEWDEAGFLVGGDRGVYVHCNVMETCARFAISGKPVYVGRICQALGRATDVVASMLRDDQI